MDNNMNEIITQEEKERVMGLPLEVAKIVSTLPEKEQEKMLFFVKCAELFSAHDNTNKSRAAV